MADKRMADKFEKGDRVQIVSDIYWVEKIGDCAPDTRAMNLARRRSCGTVREKEPRNRSLSGIDGIYLVVFDDDEYESALRINEACLDFEVMPATDEEVEEAIRSIIGPTGGQ